MGEIDSQSGARQAPILDPSNSIKESKLEGAPSLLLLVAGRHNIDDTTRGEVLKLTQVVVLYVFVRGAFHDGPRACKAGKNEPYQWLLQGAASNARLGCLLVRLGRLEETLARDTITISR